MLTVFRSGNDYLVQLPQFTALYELGQQNGDSIDLEVLTQYRNTRFQESINNNPYFFNAPFSGVLAQPAAWSFIYRKFRYNFSYFLLTRCRLHGEQV